MDDGFKVNVQRVNNDAVASRLPVARRIKIKQVGGALHQSFFRRSAPFQPTPAEVDFFVNLG